MTELRHETHTANGISMHVARQGEGPLVLLCHGFPESWYSWRHQLPVLAGAGYCAVAPDMRGYGRTDAPQAIEAYSVFALVGDLVGLLDALGHETAIVVGHDWGAHVAWQAALLRPDRFRAVAALSVPFNPRPPAPPTVLLRKIAGENFMYMLYFQEPGVAEAELDANPRSSILRMLYAGGAEGRGQWKAFMPKRARLFEGMSEPPALPAWLTEADLAFYAGEFARTGFRGGLNWYRNLDRNWELTAPWHGARVAVPALYVAGEYDLVIDMRRASVDELEKNVPDLRGKLILPGCGHWTQQERPAEVNEHLLAFVKTLL